MTTSLISLCRDGQNLPGANLSQINYPAEGFQNLQKMESHHFWFRARRMALLKILKNTIQGPALGLDIGCGTGRNASFFSENGFPTIGVDVFDSFQVEKSKKISPGFVMGDIFAIEPQGEFDFVVLLDVIEHIQNDSKFLAQAIKFLKPNGVLLISVPAFQFLWSSVDEVDQHFRRYDKSILRKLVNSLSSEIGSAEKISTEGNSAPLEIEKQLYFFGLTLPLYYLSRLKNRTRQATMRQEVEIHPAVNELLFALLKFEMLFMPFGGFPLGSSLFCLVRKKIPRY